MAISIAALAPMRGDGVLRSAPPRLGSAASRCDETSPPLLPQVDWAVWTFHIRDRQSANVIAANGPEWALGRSLHIGERMASSVQELAGLSRALDRLEARIKSYRTILLDMSLGRSVKAAIEDEGVTTGEVETIEALVRRFARRVTATDPAESEWEPLHPYCSRNESKGMGSWAEQNYEYFRWALLWLQKTRTYLEYLSGLNAAEGEPRDSGPAPTGENADIPRYDVALSFAGEDRDHARKIAQLLRAQHFSVFYDEYEQATLWGRNLYTHLSDVYQNRARYCLMFISANYARKLWTKRERESAQARAFRESREYILPLRLDDTALPGIEDTVGYIDLTKTTYEDVVKLLTQKLKAA